MKIPKDLADKARRYEKLQLECTALCKELTEWFNENGADGVYISAIFTCDEPCGEYQHSDGEWCDQSSVGDSGDSFEGNYYHQVEDDSSFVGYSYWC